MTGIVNAAEDRVPVQFAIEDALTQREARQQIVYDHLDRSRQVVGFAKAGPAIIAMNAKQQKIRLGRYADGLDAGYLQLTYS